MSILGLDKLVEVVAQGIGGLAKPWMIRRIAAAEADGLRMLEVAKTDAEIERRERLEAPKDGAEAHAYDALALPELPVLLLGESSVTSRIEQRLHEREQVRQSNLERISLGAGDLLKSARDVDEEPVDPDWIARFFSHAQDVSSVDMQKLWSMLLAREVSAPRSIPMRALDILRNMTAKEAELFDRVRRYVLFSGNSMILPAIQCVEDIRAALVDCGLVSSEGYTMPSGGPDDVVELRYAGASLAFSAEESDILSSSLGMYRFTSTGAAIARALGFEDPLPSRTALVQLEKYQRRLVWKIRPDGYDWMSIPTYLQKRREGLLGATAIKDET